VIFELKTRVDELKMENAYQLRLRDVSYNEKIKELTEKFVQDMEQLKTKIAVGDLRVICCNYVSNWISLIYI